jgi:hypothetical protein
MDFITCHCSLNILTLNHSHLHYLLPSFFMSSPHSQSLPLYISLPQELIHTVKMMESILTIQEVHALREIVPKAFPAGDNGDYLVSYVELDAVLAAHTPRNDPPSERNPMIGTALDPGSLILFVVTFILSVHITSRHSMYHICASIL